MCGPGTWLLSAPLILIIMPGLPLPLLPLPLLLPPHPCCLLAQPAVELLVEPGAAGLLSAKGLLNSCEPCDASRGAAQPRSPTDDTFSVPREEFEAEVLGSVLPPSGTTTCDPEVRPEPAALRGGCAGQLLTSIAASAPPPAWLLRWSCLAASAGPAGFSPLFCWLQHWRFRRAHQSSAVHREMVMMPAGTAALTTRVATLFWLLDWPPLLLGTDVRLGQVVLFTGRPALLSTSARVLAHMGSCLSTRILRATAQQQRR